MHHARLTRHPATPCPAVSGIDVRVAVAPGGGLAMTYTLSGDIGRLSIPASSIPARKDGLWRHTCFEAFVMASAGPAYREYNFAPSGDWAAYSFSAYRDGGAPVPMPPPTIACQADGTLELTAILARTALPESGPLRLGLSAVIEERDGMLSYWALRHPSEKPDFHHTDAFVLEFDL